MDKHEQACKGYIEIEKHTTISPILTFKPGSWWDIINLPLIEPEQMAN